MGDALENTLARSRLKQEVVDAVRKSTECIFGLVTGTSAPNPTLLVVGRVQSGKTLSFTCLIARMADAGGRLVFVLGGTKEILAKQTYDRLRKALDERQFVVTFNASVVPETLCRQVESAPFFAPRTHVIVLLKNASRIRKIAKSLSQIGSAALGNVLVIDDEADSAGLNTRIRQGDASSTYRAISLLRRGLPRHVYAQYTATPQANLLIPLFDHLSPDRVYPLEQGDGYVGGETLFDAAGVACSIPASDNESADDGCCPAFLSRALMEYLVGFASWAKRKFPDFAARSMLVHPSQRINSHELYKRFIRAKLGFWRALADSSSPDERALLHQEISDACARLASTCAHLDVTADEVLTHFNALMQEVEVRTVNSESDININWDASRGWILVGGANLDRGFTIPGLAVTYMPRGAGQGNVDTLLQRGRFFGYIRPLLSECRVYLDGDVLDRYKEITIHERDVHRWLGNAAESKRSVQEIRREFVLSPLLRPTRAQVMDPAVFMATPPEWFEQSAVPKHLSIAARNKMFINSWLLDAGYLAQQINDQGETPFQRHVGYKGLPLGRLVELLKQMAFGDPEETQRWCVAIASLDAAVQRDASLLGSVCDMRPEGNPERRITNGVVQDLLQGRGQTNGYPGDRAFTDGVATLQVHTVDLYEDHEERGRLVHPKISVLALWISPDVIQRIVRLDPPIV